MTPLEAIETRTIDFMGYPFVVAANNCYRHDAVYTEGLWGSPRERFINRGLQQAWQRSATLRGAFGDVGANFGFYSVLAAHYGCEAVHAFEPHPANHAILERNLGSWEQAKVHPMALTNYDGECKLLVEDPNMGSFAVGEWETEREALTVQARQLDTLELALTVLKIDVEGHALQVLEGAAKTLADVQLVILDAHTQNSQTKAAVREIESAYMLSDLGFSVRLEAFNKPVIIAARESHWLSHWERIR